MKTAFSVIAIGLILSLPLWLRPFAVEGNSMEPALSHGDIIMVDKLSIKYIYPRRGEVLVFRNPHRYKDGDEIQVDVKRVIGLPGETVEGMFLGTMDYFVMGDNRGISADSRRFGAVQPENFVGRTVSRIYPISRLDFFPFAEAFKHSEDVQ